MILKRIKKIAVFTSIRSEYGTLKSLLKLIENDPELELSLLVGGAHFLEEFGNTVNEIIEDGFKITYKLPFLSNDHKRDVNTRAAATLASQASDYFAQADVDLLILIGDRFELLPIATAALILNIPIGHISGGEVTEGAIDNQVRHAISKMAQVHFVATEYFKQNLMQMGEEDWRINVCGELGLDEIAKRDLVKKEDLFKDLGLDLNLPLICATFHSETIENNITPQFVKKTLEEIIEKTNYQILITAANFDEGGREINEMLNEIGETLNRVKYCRSLGKLRYFSLLKASSLVLGNSSSGLVEVQSFNIPVINVGKRQQGRLANLNVLNVEVSTSKILEGITLVESDEFRASYFNLPNIYGKGNSASSIVDFIKNLNSDKLLLKRTVFNKNDAANI